MVSLYAYVKYNFPFKCLIKGLRELLSLYNACDRCKNEYGEVAEWYWQEKIEVLTQKLAPLPLCPPQIPQRETRDWTRASEVCRPATNHLSHGAAHIVLWADTLCSAVSEEYIAPGSRVGIKKDVVCSSEKLILRYQTVRYHNSKHKNNNLEHSAKSQISYHPRQLFNQTRFEIVGHVNRMENERTLSQVFNNNPQGSRPRGRPRNRWWNCVQKYIKKCKINNWKER
jgi:hypothetical protein